MNKPDRLQPPDGFPAGLGQPALRALAAAGIHSLPQLAGWRESDVHHLHGVGPNALDKLRRALAENGLSFRPEESK